MLNQQASKTYFDSTICRFNSFMAALDVQHQLSYRLRNVFVTRKMIWWYSLFYETLEQKFNMYQKLLNVTNISSKKLAKNVLLYAKHQGH